MSYRNEMSQNSLGRILSSGVILYRARVTSSLEPWYFKILRYAARSLERAAKRRHDKEKMLETEVAYEGRRSEVNRIRQRYDRLWEKLHQRHGVPLRAQRRAKLAIRGTQHLGSRPLNSL